jgi:hypothetical protein
MSIPSLVSVILLMPSSVQKRAKRRRNGPEGSGVCFVLLILILMTALVKTSYARSLLLSSPGKGREMAIDMMSWQRHMDIPREIDMALPFSGIDSFNQFS